MQFFCGNYQLDLSVPRVMGIVNVTPDSFSDGGQLDSPDKAVRHAWKLVEDGAAILDIGGESTRPGAAPVDEDEELRRVIPVIKQLAKSSTVPLSIDTSKPAVMRAAIEAGADIVNDVCALQVPGALDVVAASTVGVCLMHMQGMPQTMQADPHYDDVTAEVVDFLSARLQAVLATGISRNRILLDPGFGFGKRTLHNITLLQNLARITNIGQPVLAGLSRKSVLGQIVGGNVDERLHASLAASVIAAMNGARILRVHDVKATSDALKVVTAVL